MSSIIEQHIPCPCGRSSDAYCVYDDGHGFCFSCSKSYREEVPLENVSYVEKEIDDRSLSLATVKHYGALTKLVNDKPVEIGLPYSNGSVKVRSLDPNVDRKFKWRVVRNDNNEGPNKVGLFGSDKFRRGGYSSVTITEGELDAMSVWEMSDKQTAAVSVQSASSCIRDCKQDMDFLMSFKKIIICFDNDTPGKEAAAKLSTLFPPDRVYIVSLDKYKDANEYLVNGATSEFMHLWNSAKKVSAESFINTFDDVSKSLEQSAFDVIGTYPLESLQTALRGLVRGEMVVFKGLEGIGKTEIFRAIQHHLLKNHKNVKIGVVHMEEDKSTTIKGVATYEEERPMYFDEDGISKEEIEEAYKKAVGNDENRFYIYDVKGGDDPNEILASIRQLVVTSGVDIIFVDNLNKMVDSLEEDRERQTLVYLASKLKTMAMDLRICICLISHVNDDGKMLGSRYTAKVADKVIHMERDVTNVVEDERRKLYLKIEKGRMARRTGNGGVMIFDPDKWMLVERTEE